MNTRASFIEDLQFSKAHDTWASKNEFDQLYMLLAGDRSRALRLPETKKTIEGAKTIGKTGVHSKILEPTDQNILREQLQALIDNDPKNYFFKNLAGWSRDFSPKQAACIKRNFEEKFRTTTKKPEPNDNEDEYNDNITDEERADSNWTPF